MHAIPTLGDIGEPQRIIEIEPFPEAVPVQEPAAPVRETEPAQVAA